MSSYEELPPFTSEKPCPHCKELLHWSEQEQPPTVHFDTRTGIVSYVELMRFCISCGYKEMGFVWIDRQPLWIEIPENLSRIFAILGNHPKIKDKRTGK